MNIAIFAFMGFLMSILLFCVHLILFYPKPRNIFGLFGVAINLVFLILNSFLATPILGWIPINCWSLM